HAAGALKPANFTHTIWRRPEKEILHSLAIDRGAECAVHFVVRTERLSDVLAEETAIGDPREL
ncbi:MAG: hypothetical protein ACE147_14990, partial [Candidatus Methylomirabilales bacterium]